MLNLIKRSKILHCRIIMPVLASVVTVACVLATSDISSELKPVFNTVKSSVLVGRRLDETQDLGLEDPKGAVECWEKHGNFYYHVEYLCLVLTT